MLGAARLFPLVCPFRTAAIGEACAQAIMRLSSHHLARFASLAPLAAPPARFADALPLLGGGADGPAPALPLTVPTRPPVRTWRARACGCVQSVLISVLIDERLCV